MKRRDFLKFLILSGLLSACDASNNRDRIGLALGGGGARGLAHVPMLEVFDELNIRPYRIAGTSIGAIMGALYASGLSGLDIRNLVDRLTVSEEESWLGSLFNEDVGRWWDLVELQVGKGGLVDTGPFADFLKETIKVSRFEELGIPLKVVSTDFWKREPVVFDSGDLFPALQASIAIPGLFSPVEYKGHVLVDGGLVNPVPYDLLFDDCEVVIAIDVSGTRTPESGKRPGYFETTFNAFQIMQSSIVSEKMKRRAPNIYIRPDLNNIRVLEFYRAEEIYSSATLVRDELRQELRKL